MVQLNEIFTELESKPFSDYIQKFPPKILFVKMLLKWLWVQHFTVTKNKHLIYVKFFSSLHFYNQSVIEIIFLKQESIMLCNVWSAYLLINLAKKFVEGKASLETYQNFVIWHNRLF